MTMTHGTSTHYVREGDPTTYNPRALVQQGVMQTLDARALVLIATGATPKTVDALLTRTGGRLDDLVCAGIKTFTDSKAHTNAVLRLRAAYEIARRVEMERNKERKPMRGPSDVAAFFYPILGHLEHEEFHVAVLDAQHRIKRDILITRGLLNSSLVHPREVFREAISQAAAAIILVHNHPSGDPTPSAEDRAVTEQIVAAGRLLDIPVHDHIIICRNSKYVSFAEAGLL